MVNFFIVKISPVPVNKVTVRAKKTTCQAFYFPRNIWRKRFFMDLKSPIYIFKHFFFRDLASFGNPQLACHFLQLSQSE